MSFHHRQGQRFQPCPDAGRPEAVLGKAVGQAAAKGQRRAIGIEPVDELLREQLGALAVKGSTPGVGICGKFRVEQPVILDGPRDVVILLHRGAIGGPAVAAVIAVDFAKTVLQQLRAVRHPHAFQGKVYKDAEKLPVAVRMVWALICPSHAARFCFSVSESGVHSFSGAVRMPQAIAAIST